MTTQCLDCWLVIKVVITIMFTSTRAQRGRHYAFAHYFRSALLLGWSHSLFAVRVYCVRNTDYLVTGQILQVSYITGNWKQWKYIVEKIAVNMFWYSGARYFLTFYVYLNHKVAKRVTLNREELWIDMRQNGHFLKIANHTYNRTMGGVNNDCSFR